MFNSTKSTPILARRSINSFSNLNHDNQNNITVEDLTTLNKVCNFFRYKFELYLWINLQIKQVTINFYFMFSIISSKNMYFDIFNVKFT